MNYIMYSTQAQVVASFMTATLVIIGLLIAAEIKHDWTRTGPF